MGLRRLPRVGAAHLALNSYILFRRVESVTSGALIPINVILQALCSSQISRLILWYLIS